MTGVNFPSWKKRIWLRKKFSVVLALLDLCNLKLVLKPFVQTSVHLMAVLNNIQFTGICSAKSYSSIFSTLNTKSEIEESTQWTNGNESQTKAKK